LRCARVVWLKRKNRHRGFRHRLCSNIFPWFVGRGGHATSGIQRLSCVILQWNADAVTEEKQNAPDSRRSHSQQNQATHHHCPWTMASIVIRILRQVIGAGHAVSLLEQ